MKKNPIQNEKAQQWLSWGASALIVGFFLLVTIGSYIKIKTAVVIVYSVAAVILLLLSIKESVKDLLTSPMMILWIVYGIIGTLSTVFIAKERDMYILFSQVSFTLILFALSRYVKYEDFFKIYRIFVLVLVGTAFFQEVTGILLFHFLKEGTQFIAADVTHGILSIFEYRHYFGCYILLAFFSLFFYPNRFAIVNLAYGFVFILAVVLTYTRCIWIAFVAGMLLLIIYAIIQMVRRNKAGTKRERRKPGRYSWIPIAVFAVLLLVFVILFRNEILTIFSRAVGRITELNPDENSWYNRFFTIINGPKYMFEHPWLLPIGGGAGSALKWLSEAEGARFRGAIDCQYVHTLMETGLSGLLVFLSMIVYSFVQFFRSKEKYSQLFSLTFLVIAVALFFFEAVVVNSSVYALWVFVLVSCCRKSEQYFCTAQKG